MGSAKRQYLRIQRRGLTFDIGAAPFGRGFFFSWWLVEVPARFVLVALGVLLAGSFLLWRDLVEATSLPMAIVLMGVAWIVLGFMVRNGTVPGEDTVRAMPVVGWLYERILSPPTYHKLDTAYMFQESVRSAVMEVVEGFRSAQGLRALSPEEKRPTVTRLSGS